MAMDRDFPQIKTQILAADMDELEKEEESHLSINYASYNSDELHNRYTPLRTILGKNLIIGRVYTKVRSKFKSHHSVILKEVSSTLISTLFFRLCGLFSEHSTLYAVTPLGILVGGFHCKVMVLVVEVSFNSHTVFVPIVEIYPTCVRQDI